MHHWQAVFGFLVAAGVAVLVTPVVGRVARALGTVDRPRVGGLTERVTPLLGGVAILIAIVVAALLFMPHFITLPRSARTIGERATVNSWGLIVGAVLITVVGAIDDWLDLRWWLKLFGQVAAAVIAVKAGAVVTDVTIPFLGAAQFPQRRRRCSRVIWLVALMNVVNFSDGVDGLAAGLCTIDGVAFAIIAFDLGVARGRDARRDHRRRGARLPRAQLPSGVDLHGGCRLQPARLHARGGGGRGLAEDQRGRCPDRSAGDPRDPVPRHELRHRQASEVQARPVVARRQPLPPPVRADRLLAAQDGRLSLRLVAVLAGLAVAMRLLPYHPHNTHYDWLWVGVLIGIGVVALAASVYLVVVLEIVKFGRLRLVDLRRADPAAPEEEIQARAARDVETGEFERVR